MVSKDRDQTCFLVQEIPKQLLYQSFSSWNTALVRGFIAWIILYLVVTIHTIFLNMFKQFIILSYHYVTSVSKTNCLCIQPSQYHKVTEFKRIAPHSGITTCEVWKWEVCRHWLWWKTHHPSGPNQCSQRRFLTHSERGGRSTGTVGCGQVTAWSLPF